MSRPRAATLLALVGFVSACRCGDSPGGSPELWVGAVDAPRIDAVDRYGALAQVAAPPAIDTPARALLALLDGRVLVLQEPDGCDGGVLDLATGACVPATAPRRPVAPGVLLDRDGNRAGELASVDGGGAPLFTWAAPPWAATEDTSGRIWVTGRTAPVVYGAGGAIVVDPAPLPFATRGAAALADGRVAVSYGVQDLAVYASDGTIAERLEPALGADYVGIDALLALPGGDLLVGSRRFGVTSAGVVLEGRLDHGALTLVVDPALCTTLGGGRPSALVRANGAIVTAPPLGRLFAPECGRWLSADLRADHGCVAPEPHRGAAWVE